MDHSHRGVWPDHSCGTQSQEAWRLQAERDTIKEREALEAEEAAALEHERQRLEARKLQTKEIVVDTIAKEEAAARAAAEVRDCITLMPLPAPPACHSTHELCQCSSPTG